MVLVDRGSAGLRDRDRRSADRKRATVVGTRTFGKGVFQQVELLSNGGCLDITVGELLPAGLQDINGGLQPSVKATDDPETERDEALPKALDTLAGKP